jgi:hypothetical protein
MALPTLHRRNEQVIRMTDDQEVTAVEGPELCQRIRTNTVTSIAVGHEQTVQYVCSRPITVIVVDQDEREHGLCDECAPVFVAEVDTAQLRGWGHEVTEWARVMGHRPEIAQWLTTFAAGFEECAKLAGTERQS